MTRGNMLAGWSDKCKKNDDHEYLAVTLRWGEQLHEELGEPAFVSVTINRTPTGAVFAMLSPATTTKRNVSWTVKPKVVRDDQWYELSAALRTDIREDTKHLKDTCRLQPADGWVSDGKLVCALVVVVELPTAEETPQPTDAPVLPLGEADDPTPTDANLRPAWAMVKLEQKRTDAYLEELKQVWDHRRRVEENATQDRMATRKFRQEIMAIDTRNVQALESIATSLKVLSTAVPPTVGGVARIANELERLNGGPNAKTPETKNQD